MSICYLNHKYLKDNAKPGSWRRGYEVYQKNLVTDVELSRNVLKAHVKGNYKDHYDVSLTFKKGEIVPSCSCPLEEKWCKHVIALGLKAIDSGIYDEYAAKKFKMPVDNSDEVAEPCDNPQGSYVFHFNPKRRQNFFSILVMERATGKVVRDIEGVFKKIIAKQKSEEGLELNNAQKINFEIFKMLLTQSRLDKKAGWYDVPILKFDAFFKMLAKAEEVIDGKTKAKLRFTSDIWTLAMSVNFSMVGNVLVALYWKRPDKDDILPFEEIRYFSRQLQWGRYKNVIFPTNISVSALPI